MIKTIKKPSINNQISRDSNIEIYRIISMLLIIAHHYVVNSGLTNLLYANPTYKRSLFLFVFGAFGKTGINCFVLITGYFMCKSKISAKKFTKLLLEVMFYRFLFNGIFWVTSYEPFTLKSLIYSIIPVRNISHNFTGTFLMFFLLIPFINKLIFSLNEKQHFCLILLTCFTYVFFETVTFLNITMNYVSWYIVLYFIASYIRLYPKKLFFSKKFWGILSFLFLLLSISSVLLLAFYKEKIGALSVYEYVTDSNTFLAVSLGVSSFMLFKNLNIKPNRLINTISSTCFGVLMIHANSDSMRTWLWKDFLNNIGMFKSDYIYLHAILSVIMIFFVCCIIDLLRIKFLEKPFFKYWDKHWDSFLSKYKKIEAKILNILEISD